MSRSVVLTLSSTWTVAHEYPLSMDFSRQEFWSGKLLPSPGHLPDPRLEPRSPGLQADCLPLSRGCIQTIRWQPQYRKWLTKAHTCISYPRRYTWAVTNILRISIVILCRFYNFCTPCLTLCVAALSEIGFTEVYFYINAPLSRS